MCSSLAPSSSAEFQEALHGVNVCPDGKIDRREELDKSGAVDYEADPPGQVAHLLRVEPRPLSRSVAREDVYALGDRLLAELFDDGAERGRVQHFRREALLP